jgi:endonuclease/exonuclease/phosphatase family metal-dependent hydrolase
MLTANSIRVASSNIRFSNPADGPNDWVSRRMLWAHLISEFSPCVLGTQEGRLPQIKDAAELLTHMSLADQHRQWIDERMYPCFFYDPTRLELIESGDIWLSQTPEIAGSKSFNSAFPRLCTWMIARSVHYDKYLFFANTHLDHLQAQTRAKQIEVLIDKIKEKNKHAFPLILAGDFNEAPDGAVREALKQNFKQLIDPWQCLQLPEETSHHKFCGINDEGARIDWILADQSLTPKSIFLDKTHVDGIWPSDHFIVKAEFEF